MTAAAGPYGDTPMITKFQRVEQAIAYVCQGVFADGDRQHAEVSWFPDGHTMTGTRFAVSCNDVRRLLTQTCRRFYETTAVLLPARRGDPPSAGLQCRCDKFARTTCRQGCRHHDDRPIALVLACSGQERPTPETLQQILRDLQRIIQKDHEEYVTKHRFKAHGPRMRDKART